MNIDIKALEAIEADKGIGVDDLLTTIAEALLHAYYAHRGEVEDEPRARVDIDAQTGTVNVMITQVDDDGNVINEFDDTPNNFGRIGAHAVRDAIVRRLREAETSRAFDAYSDFEGRVIPALCRPTPALRNVASLSSTSVRRRTVRRYYFAGRTDPW